MRNNETFEAVIEHLAAAEYIVTNSYHGAYWVTLLNRKVITYPPKEKEWRHGVEFAKNYPTALEECRESNVQFYILVGRRDINTSC